MPPTTADARVKAIRAARAKQGHALTPLQEAIIRTMAAHDPTPETLADITAALDANGTWQTQEEWRISTWFDSQITRGEQSGRLWFTAAVACDGQSYTCGCPTLERAYSFMRFYQSLIIDQFYSVGPPWA